MDRENNLKIWSRAGKSDSSTFNLNLKNVKINDTRFTFYGAKNSFLIDNYIESLSGKIEVADNISDIDFKIDTDLNSMKTRGSDILPSISDINIRGALRIDPDSLFFDKCLININKHDFAVAGSIQTKNKSLDLGVNTMNLSLDDGYIFLPEEIMSKLNKYVSGGNLSSDIKIIGKYKPENKIALHGEVNLKNLIIKPGDKVTALSFQSINSSVEIPLKDPVKNAIINVKAFDLSYAESQISGSIFLRNPESPYLDLSFRSSLMAERILKHHQIDDIKFADGLIHATGRIRGNTGPLKDISFKKILGLGKFINFNLDEVNVLSDKYGLGLSNIAGNIMIADNVWIDGLSFIFEEQNFVINGKIDHFSDFVSGSSDNLNITAGIWADRFDLKSIIRSNDDKTKSKASPRDKKMRNISADLTIAADSLIIGDFRSSLFNGSASYRNNFLNVSSFNMIGLGGSISGNAGATLSGAGGYMTRGWFDMDGINIKSAFASFNNFGQKSISDKNLEGILTGSISLSLNTDSLFKPIMSSLKANGYYSVIDGALLHYEPAAKLSRFIEIDELENIRFEELKNDLIISDSKLMIPSMDINSSAFNISLSGEQSFAGEFEYHLKVALSDILGKKAKKSESYISEFGTISDDGLGKNTLYLRLKGGPAGTEVSYDVKKLAEDIKTDIKVERQVLRTILNEEFGWYKNDSIKVNSEEKSRKFRITWEEEGRVETIAPPVKTEKSNIFKRLKKKNENQVKNDSIIKKF